MRSVLVLLVALVFLVPTAHAQSLQERLADFHFEKVVFTVTWDDTEDKAMLIVRAENLMITGDAARDLRRCIDGQECTVPELSFLTRDANRDGEVDSDEIHDFETGVLLALQGWPEAKAYLANMKGIVQIDDRDASSISPKDVEVANAEGSIESTEDIRLTLEAQAVWNRLVVPADTHKVRILRYETNFTISDRVEIRAGDNWRIKADSVQPDQMAQFFEKGRIEASQEEFESNEPLVFTIEHHESRAGTYFLWGSLFLLVAGGAGGFVWWRRHKV